MSNTVQIEKAPGRNVSDSRSRAEISSIKGARTGKRRKATALTVDNADVFFGECFDLDSFTKCLDRSFNEFHDRNLIYNFIKDSVISSKVVPFTSASKRHLRLLGIDIVGDLDIDPNTRRALDLPDSLPNKILREHVVAPFQKHFSLSKESGCRCVIDQFLLAAAVYAQQIIDADTDIKDELFARYFIRKPHVAVFAQLPVPKTTVSHNGVSYVLHGRLDYGVGLIKSGDQDALEDGRYKPDVEQVPTSVVEAKSLDDMEGAHAQIIMQVLTVLVLTGRTSFTGALSNGAMWRFYTAEVDGESGYRVYASDLYAANKYSGLIVELLKDMILYNKSPLITTVLEGPPDLKKQRTV